MGAGGAGGGGGLTWQPTDTLTVMLPVGPSGERSASLWLAMKYSEYRALLFTFKTIVHLFRAISFVHFILKKRRAKFLNIHIKYIYFKAC